MHGDHYAGMLGIGLKTKFFGLGLEGFVLALRLWS